MANIYRDAAKRSNQRAREQVQAVLARIDYRLKQKDWKGNVDRVRTAFKEHGGAAKLTDLRADIRLRLLNDDSGLSANVAKLSLLAVDSAIKAASKGDLNEVAGHLRRIMDSALHGFESPEMGRQPIGLEFPDGPQAKTKRPPIRGGQDVKGWCVVLAVCLAWAYSSFVVALIVCFAVPFCFCCYHMAAALTFAAHQALCVLLNNACAGG